MAGSRVLKASLAAAVVSSLGLATLQPAAASATPSSARSWPTRPATPRSFAASACRGGRARHAAPARPGRPLPRLRPDEPRGLLAPAAPALERVSGRAVHPVDLAHGRGPLPDHRGHHVGERRRRPQRWRRLGRGGARDRAPARVQPRGRGASAGPDEHRHGRRDRGRVELQLRHRLLPRARSQRRPGAASRHLGRLEGRCGHRPQLRQRRLRAPGGAPELGQPQAGHLRPHRGRRPRDRRGDERRHRRRGRPLRPLDEHRLRLLRGLLLGQRPGDGDAHQVAATSASTTRSTRPTATSSTRSWSRPT